MLITWYNLVYIASGFVLTDSTGKLDASFHLVLQPIKQNLHWQLE